MSESGLQDLIDAHWAYVKGVIEAHNGTDLELAVAEFHYKSAFKHGWKHAKEDKEPPDEG